MLVLKEYLIIVAITFHVVYIQGHSIQRGEKSWTAKCSVDQTWRPSDMACVPDRFMTCDAPPLVENAVRVLPSRYVAGEAAVYKCEKCMCGFACFSHINFHCLNQLL